MNTIPCKVKNLTAGMQIKLEIAVSEIKMVTISGITDIDSKRFIHTSSGTIMRDPERMILTYQL